MLRIAASTTLTRSAAIARHGSTLVGGGVGGDRRGETVDRPFRVQQPKQFFSTSVVALQQQHAQKWTADPEMEHLGDIADEDSSPQDAADHDSMPADDPAKAHKNFVELVGTLTLDPKSFTTAVGKPFVGLLLKTEVAYLSANKREARSIKDNHTVYMFGELAAINAVMQCKAGTVVRVVGNLRYRKQTNGGPWRAFISAFKITRVS